MKKNALTLCLLTSVALAGISSAACAQDGHSWNWSGPYVGVAFGSAGSGKGGESLNFDTNLDGNYGDTVNTVSASNAFSPGFCDGAAMGTTPAAGCTKDRHKSGLSLRAGYDWSRDSFVYGVVAEVSNVDMSDSVSGFSTTPAAYSFTRKLDSIMAVRARAGYVMDRWLVYGTAGYAWADIDRSFATTNSVNSFAATNGKTSHGYQVGLGVEKVVAERWAIGIEYLHTSLEDKAPVVRAGPSANTFASNPFLQGNSAGTDIRRSDDRFEVDAVMVTVSYRFGG